MTTFFDELLGFPETTGDAIRTQLRLDGTRLTSLANNRSYEVGTLTTPSLDELRDVELPTSGELRVREVVSNVEELHRDPANAGALFQVASQFNLLEMVSPNATPENGVGGYELDQTQGPACAIACGAGTIYRNWLVPVAGQLGQTSNRQIDCLFDLADAFDESAWNMVNGYALATQGGLETISNTVESTWGADRDELMENSASVSMPTPRSPSPALAISLPRHTAQRCPCRTRPISRVSGNRLLDWSSTAATKRQCAQRS